MKILNKILFIIFIFTNIFSANQTIGSDSSVGAAQSTIIFDGGNNKISNYALMDGGFSLLDKTSSCSWYSVFPVKSKQKLRGGKLFLFRDLYVTSNTCFFSYGFIDANDNDIVISPDVTFFKDSSFTFTLEQVVNSVDWTFDSNYLVVGTDQASNSSLRVFSYDGQRATFRGSYVTGLPDVYSIRMRPPGLYSGIYQIGMGEADGGTGYYELRDLYFDPASGVSLAGGRQYNPDSCRAVAWYNDGTYLAFGIDNSVVKIINVPSNGDIGVATEISASGGATTATLFANDAFSWSAEHNNLAAAFDNIIEIYTFNVGSSLLYSARDNIGQPTSYVSWHPSLDYIAVGLESGGDNFRLYEFTYTTSTLTEKLSGRIGENNGVMAIDWSPDGKCLAVATDDINGENLKIYSFNRDIESFTLERTLGCDYVINTVRWSPDGNYLAWGDNNNLVNIFNYKPLEHISFKDSNLFFKGDFNINVPVEFEGDCFIDCGNNKLNMVDGGQIIVKDNSTLRLQDVNLNGLKGTNLNCVNDSGNIEFKRTFVNIIDDYNFSYGSILFSNDVIISGTKTFAYTSRVTSTIDFNSILYFSSGVTFSYSPKSSNNNLIYMKDNTSKIFFDGSSLVTSNTGVCLSRGTLFLDNGISFSSHGIAESESIRFGDGTVANDLDIYFLADAQLDIYGAFVYENTN